MQDLITSLSRVRRASRTLVDVSEEQINAVLYSLADAIEHRSDEILLENSKDLERMDRDDPKYDRLVLTQERLKGIANDTRGVAALPSPLHSILEERTMPNGLHIQKVSVPLGVIGIIYEARPNVTFDAFALSFKSGNACVLKGGSDAAGSNAIAVSIIKDVLRTHGIDEHVVHLLPPDRSVVQAMLQACGLIDIVIPRGSRGLIDFVRDTAQIPVIETGAGVCHTYIDASADIEKASAIICNAKTARPSVCNALDCLLVHRDRLTDLPAICQTLEKSEVHIHADTDAFAQLDGQYDLLNRASEEDFGREWLSLHMSIKTVDSLEEALEHIAEHSSMHSEAVVAEDTEVIDTFLRRVDAGAVYSNASTYFTDGAQFGLGAEIGISTQKLHARGPMGLREMTTYKWVARGNGTIRE